MGMFDSVYFEGTEGFPEDMFPDLVQGEWQTKDLYNNLYELEFKGGQLYYIDRDSVRHELPFTGVFEVHNYDQPNDVMYEFFVSVKDGKLVQFGKSVDGIYPAMLPTIQAMEDDAKKDAEGWANTSLWLQELEDKRTFFDKVRMNVRGAMWEWHYALEYFIKGLKKLFGMRAW